MGQCRLVKPPGRLRDRQCPLPPGPAGLGMPAGTLKLAKIIIMWR